MSDLQLRAISQVRLDIPLGKTASLMFVEEARPGRAEWWGQLFSFLTQFASREMAWQWDAAQRVFVARPSLESSEKVSVLAFLRSAPADIAAEYRTLARAIRLDDLSADRIEVVYFSDAESVGQPE